MLNLKRDQRCQFKLPVLANITTNRGLWNGVLRQIDAVDVGARPVLVHLTLLLCTTLMSHAQITM